MKLLYIEDDLEIIDFLKNFLDEKLFIVDVETDGLSGLSKASMNNYDLIIIDFNIPKMNGIDICKKLRSINNNTPIIFLTSNKEDSILLEAFNSGADDYMKKPFNKEELLARINSVINRSKNKNQNKIITYKDFKLDINKKVFYYKDEVINFSKKEFMILELLFLNQGKFLNREYIFDQVWDENDNPFTNVVESSIRNIKNRLKNIKIKYTLINNKKGFGYFIGDDFI